MITRKTKAHYPNIEAERARMGLSVSALAEALGVSYKTYYYWQTGKDIPSSKLLKIARLFNCSMEYLLQERN